MAIFEKGIWIFQYKYHDPTQGRTEIRKLVRRDLRNELSRFKKPRFDYYVFITNVELIRADFDWIERSFGKLPYKVSVWDGKKLSASLVRYPTLLARASGISAPKLLTAREYRRRLSQLNTFLDYSTPMVGRQDLISNLIQVLQTGERGLIQIHGSDGCGKTRAVLELASQVNGCRFLSTEEIDESIFPEIKETRILIIDDANRVSGLPLLTLLFESGVRIILVYPSYFAPAISRQLGGLEESSVKFELADLSREDRVSILKAQYPRMSDDMITEIEHNARGNLVLQSLMASYRSRGFFRTKDFPAWYVAKAIPRNRIAKAILEILAGLDPVAMSDALVQRIAKLVESRKHTIFQHIDQLTVSGILQVRNRRFRFRSQLLRRFVLSSACVGKGGLITGFHVDLISNFAEFASQLIPNLTIAEFDSDHQFLDEYLKSELDRLSEPNDTNAHRFALGDVLPTLGQLRPSWAARMIESILEHPMPSYTMKDAFWGTLAVSHDMIVRKIIPVLETLSGYVEYSVFARDKLIFIQHNLTSLNKEASEAATRLFRMTYQRDFMISDKLLGFSTRILEKLVTGLAETGAGKIGPEMLEESLRTEIEVIQSDPAAQRQLRKDKP